MSILETLKLGAKRALMSQMRSPWRDDGTLRVLVGIDERFGEAIWLHALDLELPTWRAKVQVLFVQNKLLFKRALFEADACCVMALSPALLQQSRLKWIHAIPAGIDHSKLPLPPDGMLITSSRGIAAEMMAEHALALLLALRLNLPLSLRNQFNGKWSQDGQLAPYLPLRDLTVAVFGLGAVGTEIAKQCTLLGIHVIGVTRSLPNAGSNLHEICLFEEFSKALPKVDAVILALPLTAGTQGLFGEREFRAMKPTAFIVNVARGGLIREHDLVSALQNNVIAGAGLDVLADEPPAHMRLFEGCQNLIITPHVSGNIHKLRGQIASRFARNIGAYLAGVPMGGVVPRNYWRDQAVRQADQ